MWPRLREDFARYPGRGLRRLARALAAQGFWAVVAYRCAHRIERLPRAARLVAKVAWLPLQKLVECATGVQIGASARIGPGLYIGHFGCLVVSGGAVIGERCNLSHGVTIGVAGRGAARGVPRLGDRVYVAAGAKLLGRIEVGSDSVIGANAVVTRDVPPGVTVGGIPARVISERGSAGLIEVSPLGFDPGPDAG